ncbi:MAG: TlpA disulfide reductase family protein [Dehalococcoidia bacterium]|nr:TlpA disulfide reductase family protein [Dehalococcoidia bacterium]
MNREKAKNYIVLSILAALVISGCGGSTIAPVIGAQAPDFTVPTLDGETISLDELRGQPFILNFWATWCGYCRYQMPFLQAAFEEKGQEMEFVGINIRENSDKVQQYVKDEGLGFTIALDGDGAVANSYNVRPIPATFFLDEQGIIKDIKIGAFMSQAELMAVLEDIY